MLVCMEKLGNITNRIVAKLIAERENKNDGGTAEQGHSTSAAAKYPLGGRSARPQVEGAAIGHDNPIALPAGEKVGGRSSAGRERAAPVGATRGETAPRRTQNVIDYREHALLLAAWGRLPELPRADGRPQHVKPRPSRQRRAELPPRGSR